MAGDEDTQSTGGEQQNQLAFASSAYLRSAIAQPVAWMEWSEAAFDRALKEDKPILLDIGAVWCHWCHVMDGESYEDPSTASLINQHFVAIKVDRDERPDVDARYQAAVSAISGQGGWPLTAFLTPEGKPYFGGTYFPPEDRHRRPGLQRVLITMAEAFANRRTEIDESADSVMEAIEQNETFSGRYAELTSELVENMASAMLKTADLRHGGFGAQPKFPHSSALDLLMDFAQRAVPAAEHPGEGPSASICDAARKFIPITLDKMAKGGVYDHLAGGFHRYSVDERWIVPHFEKLSYDNTELLKNYVHAYQAFGESEFSRVARDIIRWIDECLTDRQGGGFYASQDADHSIHDNGDYYTWTRDEAAEVLSADELRIAAEYYDIGEIGDMHHNPAKNVLYIRQPLESAARKVGVTPSDALRLLESAKRRMHEVRRRRPAPYIDRTMYVGWNGMCISSYLLAGRVLENQSAVEFALKTLDALLRDAEFEGLKHVWRYGHGRGGASPAALLDDYVFLALAALDAWEATGSFSYHQAAERLSDEMVARFFDPEQSGFFDTSNPVSGERRLGALNARRKPFQDSPTPAANPMAAILLMKLSELNGSSEMAAKARRTLETFAGIAEHFGLYAATYASAVERFRQGVFRVCVIGSDEAARELERIALRGFAINKTVIRLPEVGRMELPSALAATLRASAYAGRSVAVVCRGRSCLPPIFSGSELASVLSG